jgi:sodium-dependent phosphate transporter
MGPRHGDARMRSSTGFGVTREDLEAAYINEGTIKDVEHFRAQKELLESGTGDDIEAAKVAGAGGKSLDEVEKEDAGKWYEPKNLGKTVWSAFLHRVNKDVISEQGRDGRLAGDMLDMQLPI